MIMHGKPRRQEIDGYAIKLLIGWSAIALPLIELTLSGLLDKPLESLSASYTLGYSPRDIFVGFLFAIGAFMLAYNGDSKLQMRLAKYGSAASFAVALFPCKCTDGAYETVPYLHLGGTVVLFLVLIRFCWIFHKRAAAKYRKDRNEKARRRRDIYRLCLGLMAISVLFFAIRVIGDEHVSPRWTLAGEVTGLFGFGIAWLTASRMFKSIAEGYEKRNLFAPSPEDLKESPDGKATADGRTLANGEKLAD
jgi:hypothetical protein